MRTASQLALVEATKRYGDRVVLDRVSLTVKPGERIGVIGDNGSGKSTLLGLMAGAVRPENGDVTVVAPGGLGHLPQALDLPHRATVGEAVDLALADLRALEARMRAAERDLDGDGDGLHAYAALVAEFEARGGYEADARVDAALHALGLPGLDRGRALGTLSGGERSRLALAAVLASDPELLLLDEPTNDLDDRAVAWLERRLRAHRGTVVAITHDRTFLERVTTTVLEVDAGRVRRYGDGYAGYLAAKAAERAAQARAHEEWKAERGRHADLVTANAGRLAAIPRKMTQAGMGTGAWRARSRTHGAAGRIRQARQRLRWLDDHPAPPPPEPLRFTAALATAGAAAPEAAALDGVVVGGRLRVDALTVRAGERVLVTGPNGAGKTTLMRVLAGELRPDAGAVRRTGRVGFLRQDGRAGPADRTVLGAYAHGRPGTPDEHADALLALGLFRPSELGLRVGALSHGQRRRIELARLVSEPVDLLLLDEPTNHLSPMLVEQLEEALAAYRGALVVVTHDRRLRARFTGSRVELERGAVLAPA
ncbi:TlrC/CarA/OleB/SrmB family ABC-F type ribosomal protection protein [Actinomadura rifamycini]|uniref:TlrC/CarA/OleB/SrmB family ABC-F type ribosomal protection protein n=1 Tax=Actinomadura rifamycini TaxID=31962 RepID=UPI00047CB4D5|nr:TlrC/CarA/OleB/SrmB family ABC-F type ribosomal protection protein [Actinomadura rifamycini]